MGPDRLFVYGTLQPGESRWAHLRPYIVGDGAPSAVAGVLYDTGLDYPAGRFTPDDGMIVGSLFTLRDLDAALERLDEIEGAVRGLYRRIVVTTADGGEAWAYECNDDSLLVRRIPSGDWRAR